MSRLMATLQRKPKKTEGADTFTDDKHPGVTLEEVVKYYVYRVVGGPSDGTVLFYEVDDDLYYHLDQAEQRPTPDISRPFDIATASVGQLPVAVVATRFDNIGEAGKGVGPVTTATTLRTTGLITCVGWLLYSPTAAYLTHIYVAAPKKVRPDGIQEQVDALYEQFKAESGSDPTGLVIKVDDGNPAYIGENVIGEGDLEWMAKLKPAGVPASEVRFGAVLEHVVDPHGGARREWNGAPIKLTYKQG